MQTVRQRAIASFVLTPAFLLLLVWIGRFAGAEEVMKIGWVQFVLLAAAVSFMIAYCVTLYVSHLVDQSDAK
jgi:hypothetical protein